MLWLRRTRALWTLVQLRHRTTQRTPPRRAIRHQYSYQMYQYMRMQIHYTQTIKCLFVGGYFRQDTQYNQRYLLDICTYICSIKYFVINNHHRRRLGRRGGGQQTEREPGVARAAAGGRTRRVRGQRRAHPRQQPPAG